MQKAILLLSDGKYFLGTSFGSSGDALGEVCFNTGMTGYQEILTDPSYSHQIVAMASPHIGNYGINKSDVESQKIQVSGFIIKEETLTPSNWRSEISIGKYLIEYNITGIKNIDTRALISHIRDKGAMNGIISSVDHDIASLKRKVTNAPSMSGLDLAKEVSTKKSYFFSEKNFYVDNKKVKSKQEYSVVAYDFGIKKNILRILKDLGCKTKVIPANTKAKDVLNMNPDGIFLSNGPGDPAACKYAIDSIKEFYKYNIPLFGICLGHQLMGIASGAETIKMSHGHHGANHPVIDLKTKRVFITSQNHGFVINEKSILDLEMPNDKDWKTKRFVDPSDLRHDMHLNIVSFEPGSSIPFPETHVMEHAIYIIQGKGRYYLNGDWVDVEAGDFMSLRAFCPQACIATGDKTFRYLLYKNVNRHIHL